MSTITNMNPNSSQESIEFSNVEELMKIPFIKEFIKTHNFKRFSMKDEMLVAETANGDYSLVGLVNNPPKDLLDELNKQIRH